MDEATQQDHEERTPQGAQARDALRKALKHLPEVREAKHKAESAVTGISRGEPDRAFFRLLSAAGSIYRAAKAHGEPKAAQLLLGASQPTSGGFLLLDLSEDLLELQAKLERAARLHKTGTVAVDPKTPWWL